MEIKKSVDLDSLNEADKKALESGEKTEEDLLAEHEEVEKKEKEDKEEELKKSKEIAENQKIRAEKAEAKAKDTEEKDDLPPKNELSQNDLLALMRAKVTEEDTQEVVDYATLKKISVQEALNSDVIKSILAEKEEKRKTAEATNVDQKRKGQAILSGSDILKDAEEKGELPESEEGMEKLVETRFAKKAASK